MSMEKEIDWAFDKLIERDEEIEIDVDLNAAQKMLEQVSMAEHFQQVHLSNSCPMCGSEMGDQVRIILRAGDFFSDVCDVGCAMMLFKRRFRNTKDIVSKIEVVRKSTRKPW